MIDASAVLELGDPVVAATLRLAGALLFGSAALHKLRERSAFREALSGYRLLPTAWLAPVALGLPCVELLTALALATPASAGAGAVVGAGLLGLYAGAIAVNLMRGRRTIDCGCTGPGGRRPITPALVWRNAALASLLLLAARTPSARPWTWLDAVTLAGGVATLALLYAAFDVLLANRARLRPARTHILEPRWATR